MPSVMGSGIASKTCCRVRQDSPEPLQKTIDYSWTPCCTATVQVFLRGICLTCAFWRSPRRAHPSLAVERQRCLTTGVPGIGAGRGQRVRDDRRHHRARPPAQRWCKRGDPDKQALGRSRGGLSTKIHATVDALGNPTGFLLTPGQAHDLKGADVLLKDTLAQTILADKAYDAQARLIEPLLNKGKTVVIPSRMTNKQPREYDRDLYKARHLIENFLARLKQYRAVATRYDKTARNFLGAIHLAASMVWLA